MKEYKEHEMYIQYQNRLHDSIEGCTTATIAAIKSPLSACVYKRFANTGESM